MIEYTCPECGHDIMTYVVATYPPVNVYECPNCKWKYEESDKIIKVPFNMKDKANIQNMIDTTIKIDKDKCITVDSDILDDTKITTKKGNYNA